MNRGRISIYGITLLILVAVADFYTGSNISLFGFYLMPLSLFAWFLGIRAGCLMAAATILLWCGVDAAFALKEGNQPLEMFLLNILLRFVPALGAVCVIASLRKSQAEQALLNEKLTATVSNLEASLATIQQMQSEMHYICAWTHRVKSEGKWIPFEEFLSRNLHLNLSHGISEEGAALIEADLGPLPASA